MKRNVFAAFLAASLGLICRAQAAPEADFDFYVLSLSWSPSYCAAEGDDANSRQCGGRPYAFIVHGLWPQFERGFPEFCDIGERQVSRALVEEMADLIPSAGLVRHQWRKHGRCSGLDPRAYFDKLRQARGAVSVPGRFRRLGEALRVDPDAVEADFLRSNAGMMRDGIVVTCDNRYLREVRICLTKDLEFRSCPQVDRRACRRDSVAMPPSR